MQWVITLNLYSMDNKLSLKTFAAEALVPKETNVVLDWFLINAWALLLKLPQNKYIAWSRSILDILDANNISYCALEEQQIADSTTSLPGESISLTFLGLPAKFPGIVQQCIEGGPAIILMPILSRI